MVGKNTFSRIEILDQILNKYFNRNKKTEKYQRCKNENEKKKDLKFKLINRFLIKKNPLGNGSQGMKWRKLDIKNEGDALR